MIRMVVRSCGLALVALVVLGCGFEGNKPTSPEPLGDYVWSVGQDKLAPEIVAPNSKGETRKLSDFRGKVVLLDFWQTRCPPCKAGVPHQKQLMEQYQGKPFVLMGVNLDQSRELFAETKKKWEMTCESWWDDPSRGYVVAKNYGVRTTPTYFLIDHKGNPRYRFQAGDEKVLDQAIEKLVREVPKTGTGG